MITGGNKASLKATQGIFRPLHIITVQRQVIPMPNE